LQATIPNPVTDPFDFYQVYWKDFVTNTFAEFKYEIIRTRNRGWTSCLLSIARLRQKMDFCINVNSKVQVGGIITRWNESQVAALPKISISEVQKTQLCQTLPIQTY
jgi:hypothetical protein